MPAPFDSSIVRIYSKSERVVGAGFLVSTKYILTCAHVVADALGLPRSTTEIPEEKISLDFPLVSVGERFKAKVVFWCPLSPDEQTEDIAGLELDNPLSVLPNISLVTSDNWHEHSFRVYGFPVGQPNGVWATGVLRGRTAKDWVQLEDVKNPGYQLEPGFSGAPIWDNNLHGVAGIAVAAEMDRTEARVGFMIPTNVLINAWSAIAPCPYLNLLAFQEQDARFFFGRDQFTQQLAAAVAKQSLVAVIGGSGSGKSSVVFAGFVPHLRSEKDWLIVDFRPGNHPFENLVAKLVPLLDPEKSAGEHLITVSKLVKEYKQVPSALQKIILSLLGKKPRSHLLLIADQFEELYTPCVDDTDRELFLDQLLLACNQINNFKTILTLRADFLGYALAYRPFAVALQDSTQMLGPMSRKELQEVIERPVQMLNAKLEPGLMQRILAAVRDQPGNLPLLEFTLTQLWGKQENRQLTHRAYDEIGGLEKALAKYAEAQYQSFSEENKQRVQKLFIQLVHPGQGTYDTRRVATRQEVGEDNWSLVTKLANARLVVTNVVNNNKTNKVEETVEIIHEALIREWGTLQAWITTNREFRTWQQQLNVRVREWKSAKEDKELLLRGASLVKANEFFKEKADEMSLSEQNFVNQSLVFDTLITKQKKRRQRLTNMGFGITSLFSIGVIGYILWPTKELSVVIVTSENAPYEQVMIQSFRDRLTRQPKIKLNAPPPQKGAFKPPESPDGKKFWKGVTDDIAIRYKRQNIDYLVTAGTYATKAIRDAGLVDKLGAKGQIFIGVTDPVRSGIVASLEDRKENSNIAGVRYGTGGIDFGKEIASLFPPTQSLVFVYDMGTPQDSYVAKDIAQLKQRGDRRFRVKPLPHSVGPSDLGTPSSLNDKKEVYFAWYGLDNILNRTGGAALLRDKWVIPSTYAPENVDYAGIVVSVYDEKVGELAADILLKNFFHPEKKLGNEPVGRPPFHTWLNCDTIKRKGIILSSAVAKPSPTRDDICKQ